MQKKTGAWHALAQGVQSFRLRLGLAKSDGGSAFCNDFLPNQRNQGSEGPPRRILDFLFQILFVEKSFRCPYSFHPKQLIE
jgi:hypothetical protein